jgi:hypothetical protein
MYDGLGVDGFEFTGGLVFHYIIPLEYLAIHGNIHTMGQ